MSIARAKTGDEECLATTDTHHEKKIHSDVSSVQVSTV
jgi:hypothetical protein